MLHTLGDTPVLGVSLGNVSLLRLDQAGGPAPGNKSFKLANYFLEARRMGVSRLLSFGGAWSNHLHALAAAGRHHGVQTIGIVRGDEDAPDTAMMSDARRYGMQLLRVSRAEYRLRHDVGYQRQLMARFAPCLLIPEGGASIIGARGCAAIADLIRRQAPQVRKIVLPVGTGTTLAGLAACLDEGFEVTGISALRETYGLEERAQGLLDALDTGSASHRAAQWRILYEFHCGGFARVDARLREFMLAFEQTHGVPLEPVYTGKMMLAIHRLRERGEWDEGEPVLAIHTGGLQGRRGYPWLAAAPR